MIIEKGLLSNSQVMFLVIGYIQGSTLQLSFAEKITKQNTWIVVIIGFAVSVPLVLIYLALTERFPDKNLIEINDLTFGPYLGKAISIAYICFFLSILSLNATLIGDFFSLNIYPRTPIIVFIILFIIICSKAVKSGIEVIGRCAPILVSVVVIITLTTVLFLLREVNLNNFLPIFEFNFIDFIHSSHIMLSIHFCELIIFTMVIPYTNNHGKTSKYILLGMLIGGIQILIISLRNTSVLGVVLSLFESPSYQSLRVINISEIITRVESLYAIGILSSLFIKVCILYYGTVLGIAQIFNLRTYQPLVLPIGVIIGSLSILSFDSVSERQYFTLNIFPIYSLPFEFLIPLITLILAHFRRLPKPVKKVTK